MKKIGLILYKYLFGGFGSPYATFTTHRITLLQIFNSTTHYITNLGKPKYTHYWLLSHINI